mgnify:CR=1 FL=1
MVSCLSVLFLPSQSPFCACLFLWDTKWSALPPVCRVPQVDHVQLHCGKRVVGVMGHSQGGNIVLMFASKYPQAVPLVINIAGRMHMGLVPVGGYSPCLCLLAVLFLPLTTGGWVGRWRHQVSFHRRAVAAAW